MSTRNARLILIGTVLAVIASIVLPIRLFIVESASNVVDYKSLTTNEEKLGACERLIYEAIAEYNRQSQLAVVNRTMYEQKFRTYASTVFRTTLRELINERQRLRETIMIGKYDPEGWALILGKGVEAEHEAYAEMYGNKTGQRLQPTNATASVLAELRAIRLEDLLDSAGFDPVEDFTTYTEVDEGSDITKDSNTVTVTNFDTRRDTGYVYYDKGSNHFDGDFEHLFKAQQTSSSGGANPWWTLWMIANGIGDWRDLEDANTALLSAIYYKSAGTLYGYLRERGNGYGTADSGALSENTEYFHTVVRDDGAGSYGELDDYVCTVNYYGETGSVLEDTLHIVLNARVDFQYIYATAGYDDNQGTGHYVTGYVEDLDLQESGAPAVDTDAADDLEDTTATLNGDVTDINDTSIDTRGFVWDTSTHGNPGSGTAPADSDYANYWTEAGSFGTGVFDHGVSSLATATLHYFRAAAENDNSLWGYGDEATFLTKPAAPTNVAATDGVHTDKVVVTWTKSSGTVTGYKIYRDAGLIDTVGDVATYDDTGADAPTITPGTAVCSDGTYTDKVNIAVSGDSANVGTTHTYKVRAYNDTGDSDDSATDTGYRGVGSLTYQWWRSSTCADSGYSSLGGATTDPYDDMTAPAPTISGNNATACDGCSSAFVTLSCNETVANGACRYYHAVLSATGAASANSTSDSGYRGTTTLTYQWWRSAADSEAAYSVISGGTTDPYNDIGGVVDPDGRYYLTTVSMSGAVSVNSSPDRGYMSSGNITTIYVYPEWQSRFVGLNGTLWAVAWAGDELAVNQSVVWNTSGVGEILWSENVTGSDGRADCRIATNASGNQTVGCTGGSAYDEGMCLWVDDSPADLPTWYFVILGVALVGAWFTKEILLYIMGVVACGGMVWWAQNSTLEQETILVLTAVFVILGGVMVFGMLRKGQFSFVRGGDSE